MMRNVFAHYFTWFARKEVSGRWEHWNWEGPGTVHDPDRIVDGAEDVAAVDVPLIGAYDSGDERIHRYHLDLAEAAGIDAFTVDWYGPSDTDKNRDHIVDINFRKMVDAAAGHAVKMCICYEEKLLFPEPDKEHVIAAGVAHLRYAASEYFASPGYWHVDGRPVLVIWGNNTLSTDVWDRILAEIAPYKPWILYSYHDHKPQYADICEGFYPWVILGDEAKQRAYLEEYYATAERYIREGKSVTLGGGVWPGFDDSGVTGWGGGTRRIDDPEDRLHAITWEYVLKHQPEWVSITTWNDWNEGSNIEPGVKKGTRYLEQTAEFAAKYKGVAAGKRIEDVLARHLPKERAR